MNQQEHTDKSAATDQRVAAIVSRWLIGLTAFTVALTLYSLN
jgi:hypothetical protein